MRWPTVPKWAVPAAEAARQMGGHRTHPTSPPWAGWAVGSAVTRRPNSLDWIEDESLLDVHSPSMAVVGGGCALRSVSQIEIFYRRKVPTFGVIFGPLGFGLTNANSDDIGTERQCSGQCGERNGRNRRETAERVQCHQQQNGQIFDVCRSGTSASNGREREADETAAEREFFFFFGILPQWHFGHLPFNLERQCSGQCGERNGRNRRETAERVQCHQQQNGQIFDICRSGTSASNGREREADETAAEREFFFFFWHFTAMAFRPFAL
ncbi:hypothetical protein niasHT_036158 [Heterodera trifolii]|uniref:Uncharacterized protein n=1 Tax=Heterodera trifolii TaxID=157864 RepID=A0ABD2INH2_9BILA